MQMPLLAGRNQRQRFRGGCVASKCPLLALLRRPPTSGTRPLSGAKRKTEPFRFRPRSRTTATSILPSLNGKTAHSWRGIVPFTHLAREGRMTVTIGRRELLAALGGAAAARGARAAGRDAGGGVPLPHIS